MLIRVIAAGIPDAEWDVFAVAITAVFGFFGLLVKLLADARKDNKELQSLVIEKALPALTENAEATKLMVQVSQQILTALAVAQAVKDRGG